MMNRTPARVLVLAGAALLFSATIAGASTALWDLSTGDLSQDWSNTGLISANDDWSAVPSIMGYIGNTNAASPTNVNPTTYTAGSSGDVDVVANQNNPNTLTSGGVAEFDGIANPAVALNGSGTADTPALVIFVNSTGRQNVTLSFNAVDLDASADNSAQQLAVQYRVGGAGDFVNVPGGYWADVSQGPNISGLITPVSLSMVGWANQSSLEFRILTTNAQGNDEWVGIDDIQVTSVVPEPSSLLVLGAGLALLKRKAGKA